MITILVATGFSPKPITNRVCCCARQTIQGKRILFNAFVLPVHASDGLISASAEGSAVLVTDVINDGWDYLLL